MEDRTVITICSEGVTLRTREGTTLRATHHPKPGTKFVDDEGNVYQATTVARKGAYTYGHRRDERTGQETAFICRNEFFERA
jgi:hypothetical protein